MAGGAFEFGGEPQADEQLTTAVSGLQYDLVADQYSYVWKTDKAWGGTCRELTMKLVDGTSHVAAFRLK